MSRDKLTLVSLTVTGLLLTPIIWAQSSVNEAAANATTVTPVGADTVLSVLFGLLGIIALILALAWFARRAGATGWSRSNDMKVVASLALGTRERLLVVDIANTQILLGVTAQTVNQLHVFDKPVINADGASSSEFSQKLLSIMKGQGAEIKKNPTAPSDDNHIKQEPNNER